jgi:protein-export membrane protein, SecD/SecF family
MKRVGKPVFFILVILIAALTYTAFFGISTTYGDKVTTYIKGANTSMRWGIDIRGGVNVTFCPPEGIDAQKEEIDAAKQIIENRLISKNITDYEVYTDYDNDRIIVRFPWSENESTFDASAAIKELGETAQLTFREGQEIDQSGYPTGVTATNVILEGKDIKDARISYDENNKPVVALELHDEGKQKFSEATAKTGEVISIWLDNTIISAPTVNQQITNGEAIIQGDFSAEAAKSLADKIKGGALPFQLRVESSDAINPTLGEHAKDVMVMSGGVAFLLVIIFMILYYRLPGVVASIALTGLVAGTIACITGYFPFASSFTMTLPGIAGIILSIGMGVDCNVITNERIKEEMNKGKTIDGSIHLGSKNSFSAIFDGNITVIIVAIILMGVFGPPDSFFAQLLKPLLFMFGPSATGAIYSFGYTLLIGVIFNFIFGVTVSRLMLNSISRFKIFRKPWFYGAKTIEGGK